MSIGGKLMTIDEWVNNPSGGRVGGLEREAYKSTMTKRLDPVLVRENNDIKYDMYKAGNSVYWLRVKVPSEVVKGFTYDVIFKFSKPKTAIHMGSTPLNTSYQFQVFSNDPAFNYTHCYVYKKNGLLPKELEEKCNKMAMRTRPVDTNLHEIVTYCKSIYWAILIAKQKGLFAIDKYTQTINLKTFLDTVTHTDICIKERQDKDAENQKARQKEEKRKAIAKKQSHKSEGPDFNKTNTVNFGVPQKGNRGINFNKSKKV